jgi:uncharacterized protein (TIGR02246 family)
MSNPSNPVPEPAGAAAVEDVRAITALVERWAGAFRAGDAGPLADDYADDAEWINAFGIARRGGPAIAAFLQELIGRATWAAATFTWSTPEVRFLRPDVAVAHDFVVIRGQRTPGGAEYPERRTHGQRVLTKDGGRWRVRAHLISDEVRELLRRVEEDARPA